MSVVKFTRIAGAAVRNVHPSSIGLWTRDLFDIRGRPKQSSVHLRHTMEWLRSAHDACGRRGVSAAYSVIDGWLPPYPETTGYIIPTFYDYAKLAGEEEWRDRAVAMADWEVEVQMANGAVQAGFYKSNGADQVPAVFNTGQVILGWCRAFVETQNDKYLNAAKRAADWLVSIQDEDGAWRFRSSETETTVHAYDVRTAWALLEIHAIMGDPAYRESAQRQISWTLRQQKDNGWFENNAFFITSKKWGSIPFTHNIAYVMEGLQESHRLLGDEEYFRAYAKTAERLMRIFELKRFMPGDFDSNWKSSRNYSCLTGDAQIATVWLKHFSVTKDVRFLNAALKLNDYVKSTQNLRALNRSIRGGIKGSQPIHGTYTPYLYPNWAAKFFADSLMLEEHTMKTFEEAVLRGEKFC